MSGEKKFCYEEHYDLYSFPDIPPEIKGIRAMLAQTLYRAILDLSSNERKVRLSALYWFRGQEKIEKKSLPYFSFNEVCEVLEISSPLLLKTLENLLVDSHLPDLVHISKIFADQLRLRKDQDRGYRYRTTPRKQRLGFVS